jgi:hypothetical protein
MFLVIGEAHGGEWVGCRRSEAEKRPSIEINSRRSVSLANSVRVSNQAVEQGESEKANARLSETVVLLSECILGEEFEGQTWLNHPLDQYSPIETPSHFLHIKWLPKRKARVRTNDCGGGVNID